VIQWEYCKIIEPSKLLGKPLQSKLIYLAALQEDEVVEQIDTPEHALARLGREGWELVDHTQLFTMIEEGTALPVMEVYHLKRAMSQDTQATG
jgi:hypothetical protein